MKNQLPGVYPATKKDGTTYYRASLTHNRRHISLGSFDSEKKASCAYEEGRLLLNDDTIAINHYNKKRTLSFDKWIILINLRDNGLYFGTPIYLGKKSFHYYLSPTEILTFDSDDLFYYASHKIMKRGGHLFVCDYGSQFTLYTRYGIRPYSVEGKDYIFRNGDKYDFRRENLEVLNGYNGVRQISGGKFMSRIHIRSYLKIGEYDTALEAAIAYNKALDLLMKRGLKKAIAPNYITEIPPSKYAALYSDIHISDIINTYPIP